MDEQEISTKLRQALAGSKRVKITFINDGISETEWLLAMDNREIRLSEADRKNVAAVRQAISWEKIQDRTVTIELTDQFDEGWFLESFAFYLEKIEVVN